MLSKHEVFSRRLALIATLIAPLFILWADVKKDITVTQIISGYIIGLIVFGLGTGICVYFGAKGVFWALSREE